jgi:hypothetical protein
MILTNELKDSAKTSATTNLLATKAEGWPEVPTGAVGYSQP